MMPPLIVNSLVAFVALMIVLVFVHWRERVTARRLKTELTGFHQSFQMALLTAAEGDYARPSAASSTGPRAVRAADRRLLDLVMSARGAS